MAALFGLPHSATGQGLAENRLSELAFRTLEGRAGLPGNVVTSIAQDEAGYIWIGSWGGLARFDGQKIRQYHRDPSDDTSLIGDNVSSLLVDSSGRLWVGAQRLHLYDPLSDSFEKIEIELRVSLFHTDVLTIFEDSEGFIWIGLFQNGAVRIDPETLALTYFNPTEAGDNALSDPSVFSIEEDSFGRIWLGTQTGLEVVNAGSVEPATISPSQISSLPVRELKMDSHGTLWAGTAGGLFTLDISDQGVTTARLANNGAYVRSIFEDESGRLWVGFDGGMHVILNSGSPSDIVSIESPSLPAGIVDTIFQDRSGIIWLGTDRDGIAWSDPNSIRFKQTELSNAPSTEAGTGYVTSILEEASGRLWVGTENGLMLRSVGEKEFQFLSPERYGLPRLDVTNIYKDNLGTIWVSTLMNGISRFDERSKSFSSFLPPWPELSNVFNMHMLSDERLLVATSGGLFTFDPHSERYLKSWVPDENDNHSLQASWVRAIHADSEGRFWLGHEYGVDLFDLVTESFTHFVSIPDDPAGIAHGTVMALEGDSEGRLLISALTNGMDRYDPATKTFEHFTRKRSGLSSNYAHGMIADEDGIVWVGMNEGLNRLDTNSGTTRLYPIAGASQNSGISAGAYHEGPSGRIYFGRLDGFYSFHPDELVDDPIPPLIALGDFRIDGRGDDEAFSRRHLYNVQSGTEIDLSFDERSFSADFSVLHFRDSDANQSEYRLLGYDEAWISGGPASTITYTNLDPDEYTLEIRGRNSDGVPSSGIFQVSLNVLPPWWMTTWFRVLALAGIISIALGAHRYRLQRIRRSNLRLSRLVKERTLQVESQHAALEVQAVKLMELDEMKSRFFSNISHELRTPLTLIRGRMEDIRNERHGKIPNEANQQLETSLAQTHRLQQLIEQLLDLSRFQEQEATLQASERDLSTFVRRVSYLFDSLATVEQIKLDVDIPSDVTLHFDADKLEKILTNLIGNAFKFTPAGGTIRVSMALPKLDEEESDVNRFVRIEVRDTGQGIHEDAIPLIFGRFYQEDPSSTRAFEGMGVGLALVRELVELHGGDIEVESEPGVGSAFSILLPLGTEHLSESEMLDHHEEQADDQGEGSGRGQTDEKPPHDASAPAEREAAPPTRRLSQGEKPVVLLVEDNAELRHYLIDHLKISYQVIEAVDGQDGLDKIKALSPDIVVSDVMMPRMDGMQLLACIRSDVRMAVTPVILLTARSSHEDKIKGLDALADDYISKPFRINELKARIHNLIVNRTSIKSSLEVRLVDNNGNNGQLSSAQSDFVKRASSVVQEHIADEAFGRKMLASELNVSERTLGRKLHEASGLSPVEFIRSVRMERADSLLRANTFNTVAEVSYAVGFKTASYFTRIYRQTYGQLPGSVMSENS